LASRDQVERSAFMRSLSKAAVLAAVLVLGAAAPTAFAADEPSKTDAAKGKKIADVVFTAYILDGPKNPDRPVTFAFNGGPGAASVYLNLGAIGPKRV